MFKSPNNLYFESRGGEGDILFKGHIKAESIEATSLTAPELTAIATQLEEMRVRIREMSLMSPPPPSSSFPVPEDAPVAPESAPVAPVSAPVDVTPVPQAEKISIEPLISQIEEVRDQLRSADLPRILANIDELRAARNPMSMQQLTRLQDQVSKLVGQINTIQDRVSVIEGRLAQLSSSGSTSETTTSSVVGAISNAVGAAAAQGAATVINRAAMKLEDMVSPGALYNLRKVSDRGPVKYAW
jgi:hypothetical protein